MNKKPDMLSVLVIDESESRAADICAGLALAGHQVTAVLADATNLSERVEAMRPDIIVIHTDSPTRDTLEHLAVVHRDMPRPVVLFARESDRSVIRKAMKAGVATYVVDGLDPKRLKPVIDVAVAHFEEFQSMRKELDAATRKLADRKVIERAKGVLMKARNLDEDAAYAALRKLAMDRGQPLVKVAGDVLEMANLLL